MPSNRKASIVFIFITVLVDVIGIGIIIPIIPRLLETLSGQSISQVSIWGGLMMFSYAIMQFLFAPLIGEISDRFGRRKVLLIALFVLGIDYIFHALAPTLGWLFIGRILAGLGGGSFSVANAYVADISDPDKKAQNFGMIGAAFGLGFILGPVIGGVFSSFGIRAPFYIAAALTLLNFLYGLIILPESLKKENRRPINWRKANPLGALGFLRKNKLISRLALTYFFVYLASYAVQSTWSFFTMFRFSWTAQIVGYSLGVVGLLIALVQGGLIRYTSKKFGNLKSIIIGYCFYFIGLILFAFASESWMMFVFLIPYCIGGIAGPSLLGIMSNIVPDNEQGKLQGGLTSLQSITSILGPLLMTNIFAFFTQESAPFYFPGASFFMGSILILISLALVIPVIKTISKTKTQTT